MGREEWYQVLELEPGADAKAVKRAYFRLVKQYTPEEHPEEFQKIRAAYEALSKPPEETEHGIHIPIPDQPFLKRALDLGDEYLAEDMPESAMKLAEETMHYYGELEAILYLQARATRAGGYTGKCVKAWEKLVKIRPDQLYYRQMLALAYYDRGYMNKAMDAFQEAYAAGIRDIEFLTSYCMCCDDRGKSGLERSVAKVLLDLTRSNFKEYMEEILVGIDCLLRTEKRGTKLSQEFLQQFRQFMESALPYIPEYVNEILVLFYKVYGRALAWNDKDALDCMDRVLTLALPQFPDDESREIVRNMREASVMERFLADPSFLDTVKDLVMGCDQDSDYTAEENRFSALDAQLCFLEHWPEVQPEIHRLKQTYPGLYEIIREFIEKVEGCSDIEELRGPMLKEFDKKVKWFDGSRFYEEYPERRPRLENLIWNSEESGSFRRQQPKVGRNDPCPCGSGKK